VNGILTVKGLAYDIAGELSFYFIGSCRLTEQYQFEKTALIEATPPQDGLWNVVLLHWDSKGSLFFKDVKLFLEARGAEHVEIWERAFQGSALDQNAVGWSLSFGQKKNPVVENSKLLPHVARYWFGRCAQGGEWVGHHNLGVMLLEGVGGERDEAAAFSHLKEAARSLEPVSLRRYAECYRQGVGCPKNEEVAEALEMLASFECADDEESEEGEDGEG
jgi:TPR repeat protein